jgi:hypothetical protein
MRRVMRVLRAVALVFLAYVVLEIANPTIPGAVQLVDGAIEIVQADRARSSADAAALVTPVQLWSAPVAIQLPAPSPRQRPLRPARRRAPSRRRRPVRKSADRAPSEDH